MLQWYNGIQLPIFKKSPPSGEGELTPLKSPPPVAKGIAAAGWVCGNTKILTFLPTEIPPRLWCGLGKTREKPDNLESTQVCYDAVGKQVKIPFLNSLGTITCVGKGLRL